MRASRAGRDPAGPAVSRGVPPPPPRPGAECIIWKGGGRVVRA